MCHAPMVLDATLPVYVPDAYGIQDSTGIVTGVGIHCNVADEFQLWKGLYLEITILHNLLRAFALDSQGVLVSRGSEVTCLQQLLPNFNHYNYGNFLVAIGNQNSYAYVMVVISYIDLCINVPTPT